MKKYKSKKGGGIGRRIIAVVCTLAIIAGAVSVASYFLFDSQDEPTVEQTGIYLSSMDETVDLETDNVVMSHGQSITLKIENGDGWGEYSVQDCIVTVVPNVDQEHDFEFVNAGNMQVLKYSEQGDLTKAFTENYDGKSLSVSESGEFTLTYSAGNPLEILQKVYGVKLALVEGYELLALYPYVAVKIVSPDGKQTLSLPLSTNYTAVSEISLDKSEVIF